MITFACYGCHLHGDVSGAIDRGHNLYGGPVVAEDSRRLSAERRIMDQPPYQMDRSRREIVAASLLERCTERHWTLLAVHVRTNHVHIVVEAQSRPERVVNDLKSYASRCLNLQGLDGPARKRWARHGSTRWLWTPENVTAAIKYVVDGQGDPMSVFQA